MKLRFAVLMYAVVLLAACRQDVLPFEKEGDTTIVPPPEEIVQPRKETLPVTTGLPVMVINIDGGKKVNDKVTWLPSKIKILDEQGYVVMDTLGCSIRGRGNSTWNWSKKPYALMLDEKVQVLGMPAQKHWVLLANYMDRTLMRDALGFHVAECTSLVWTPRCRYVELILNGKHVGNYLLAEQVRPDENRVPIEKGVEGSWLFESDFHGDEPWAWSEHNIPFCVKYPDDQDMTNTLKSKAQQYITGKLDACWSLNYDTVAAALDLQSFADFWIVFEVMGNHELGNPGSIFTYANKNGKWTAGPVWDFDWGGLSYYTSPHAKTGLVNRDAVWYRKLHNIERYRLLLAERWKTLKPELLKCADFIDVTRDYLRESDKINRKMWDPAGAGNINGDEQLSFSDACARLKANYLERIQVISSIIEDGEF